jgi:hypothetical protein
MCLMRAAFSYSNGIDSGRKDSPRFPIVAPLGGSLLR